MHHWYLYDGQTAFHLSKNCKKDEHNVKVVEVTHAD